MLLIKRICYVSLYAAAAAIRSDNFWVYLGKVFPILMPLLNSCQLTFKISFKTY